MTLQMSSVAAAANNDKTNNSVKSNNCLLFGDGDDDDDDSSSRRSSNGVAVVTVSEECPFLFAIPKKGRLFVKVNNLLQGAGLSYTRANRLDIATCDQLSGVKLVFLPAADIAAYVADGNVDLGITGQDIIEEFDSSEKNRYATTYGSSPPAVVAGHVLSSITGGITGGSSRASGDDSGDHVTGSDSDGSQDGTGQKNLVTAVNQLELLGFGKCQLVVQAPVKSCLTGPEDLVSKRIVTSFPNITKQYFSQIESKKTKSEKMSSPNHPEDACCSTNIKYVSGSVEAACGLGLADGIVDLVETGTTMKAAGLEIISTILKTQAVLISNKHSKHPQMVHIIHQRILGYLTAQKYQMISYNIAKPKLAAASAVTPGRKAPTVTQLIDNINFVSVSAMVERSLISEKMDALVGIGATDILAFDIANCRA